MTLQLPAISDLRRINCNQGRPQDASERLPSRRQTVGSSLTPSTKCQCSKRPPRALLSQNDWCICIAVIVAKGRLSVVFNVWITSACEVGQRSDSQCQPVP